MVSTRVNQMELTNLGVVWVRLGGQVDIASDLYWLEEPIWLMDILLCAYILALIS